MFWNIWCEQVKYLNSDTRGSSHSETSVATSTTNSTLYLLSSRRVVTNRGIQQLWCKFGAGDNSVGINKVLAITHERKLYSIELKKMAGSAPLYRQLIR